MKLTRVIAIAIIAASGALGVETLGVAQAQSLRNMEQPAEFPPSTYTGRQYVDSEGCVFVRAGFDGNVTWVPRVSRGRQAVCNQQPTLAAAPKPEPAAEPVQAAQAQPEVQPQPQPKPKPKAAAAAPAPTSTPQRVARTAPEPTVQPVRNVEPAPKAQKVRKQPPVKQAPQPVAKAAPRGARTVAASPACPGASAASSRYTRTTSGFAVRCGPQSEPHAPRVQGTKAMRSAPRAVAPPSYAAPSYAAAPRPTAVPAYTPVTAPAAPQGTAKKVVTVDPNTRVAPRHVVRNQARATQGVSIPEGYKRVWMDGRLNPHRAHQTFAGKAQMDVMWTKTVPRRLILTDTGRDMSGHYPGLIYPYTSYEEQRAAMSAPAAGQGHTKGTISTKSSQPDAKSQAPKARAAQPAASSTGGQNYVQAGVFASRAQAQQAAQRLTRAGLPARLGSLTRGDTQYSLLLSGPFASSRDAQGALARVRGAGFGNARLR
ncbi:SPOR domain-containing protein [Roseovarius sp. D0-M9]|uniref:SPOR domain-containing protein n=1 Tax=Roseovarius sp. D0-M9 TaxID=3127117 RepID=UPI0030103FB4